MPSRNVAVHRQWPPKPSYLETVLKQLYRYLTCARTIRGSRMKSQTLQYYMHDGPAAFRFELAGDLNDEAARDLEQAWRTASSMIGDRALIVDMTFVTGAGRDGRSLLARWYADCAQLI